MFININQSTHYNIQSLNVFDACCFPHWCTMPESELTDSFLLEWLIIKKSTHVFSEWESQGGIQRKLALICEQTVTVERKSAEETLSSSTPWPVKTDCLYLFSSGQTSCCSFETPVMASLCKRFSLDLVLKWNLPYLIILSLRVFY